MHTQINLSQILDKPKTDESFIVLEDHENWNTNQEVYLLLDGIFKNDEFKKSVKQYIEQKNIKIGSLWDLIGFLRQIFRDNLKWSESDIGYNFVEQLQVLADYEKNMRFSIESYDTKLKPNPDAVFWPNPERNPGQSVFNTIPIVKNLGLLDKSTPIGSAGSCFAFELAQYLQRNGFKYIATEKEYDPDIGLMCDGYDPANPYARFSANWGILFNTPSFAQIVEKAFGLRSFKKILARKRSKQGDVCYVDPYRENVYFTTPEAYLADYERHLEATRKVIKSCKFFIITLGLNECWEYIHDGSVVSRNPHSGMFQSVLKHKILTIEENVRHIQRFIDVCRQYNPDLQLVISLSPIPFLATARSNEYHVVTANAHSKAVLRVAAEEIVKANKGVYYFPSYELVTSCTANPWTPDERHVKREVVDRVMQMFEQMFVKA